MNRTIGLIAGAVLAVSAAAADASTYNYNFKEAGQSGSTIGNTLGESIWDPFNTDSLGVGGPNLKITAGYFSTLPTTIPTDIGPNTPGTTKAYVYLDHGDAGMGVCKHPSSQSYVNVAYTGTTNRCAPSSDDGITGILEYLMFEATEEDVFVDAIWLNANHDSPDVRDAVYRVNGVEYDTADMINDAVPYNYNTNAGSGDVRIDLGFLLRKGETFSVFATTGTPDSYVSALAVSQVPVPAGAVLLLTGLGGLVAARRRRKMS